MNKAVTAEASAPQSEGAVEKALTGGSVTAEAGHSMRQSDIMDFTDMTISDLIKEVKESIRLIKRATNTKVANKIRFRICDQQDVNRHLDRMGVFLEEIDNRAGGIGTVEEGTSEGGLGQEEDRIDSLQRRLDSRLDKMEGRLRNMIKEVMGVKVPTTPAATGGRSTIGQDKDASTEARPFSYAGAVQSEGTGWRNVSKKWKPPPRRLQSKTLVVAKPQTEPRVIIEEVKRAVTHEELGKEGLKNIRRLKNGSVILECRNDQQMEAITKKLNGKMEVKEGTRLFPRFRVLGIYRPSDEQIKDLDIIDDLMEHNGCIQKLKEQGDQCRLRVIRRHTDPKRKDFENWIFETSPTLFGEIMKAGRLNVGMLSLRVEEYVDVLQCRKCCRYGHVFRNCKAETVCYNCGEEHEGKNCKNETPKCVNCCRAGQQEVAHRATDRSCPINKRQEENTRKITDYPWRN